MKSKTFLFIVFALLLSVAVSCEMHTKQDNNDISIKEQAPVINTVFVKSKSMDKMIPNLIILPGNYNEANQHYPVLFLLHGAGDDQTGWFKVSPDLSAYADRYGIIIVCPDGGKTSWYFDSPIDKKFRYETYLSKELIVAIDSQFNTIPNKQARAIAGMSMGGHGALYLGFRHQDVYGAVGSMSGGVDIRQFKNSWDISKRLGEYTMYKDNWEKNTVINLLDMIKDGGPKIIFDCGVDDFFYSCNKQLHQMLLERKIPHDYIERPGVHDHAYWRNAIQYQMVFFNDFFNQKQY